MENHIYSEKCIFSSLSDIKNKKVTIMGLGLNGGGEASVRFFANHGAYVTVTDMKNEAELEPTLNSLRSDKDLDLSRIKFVLGKHEISDFSEADCVIKNPGVKYEGNKYLAVARSIESDISIFLRFSKAPIIAVTGSKGKSSTVSAIHYGLEKAGFTCFLGGNITVSPLSFLEKTDKSTPVVLELSSWQLSDLRGRGILKPKIALITKIVPDHQNWYGNMESYVADKKLIYQDQDENDYTICTFDDEYGHTFARETKGTVVWYSGHFSHNEVIPMRGAFLNHKKKGYVLMPHVPIRDKILSENYLHMKIAEDSPVMILDKISIPGDHSRQNLLNAALVMCLFGVDPLRVKDILAEYPGIPHRLEFFHVWKYQKTNTSYKFYNDSASTIPEATAAAINSFDEKTIFICGGTDKKLEFSPLAEVASKPAELYLLAGTGTDKLLPLLQAQQTKYKGPFQSLAELLHSLKEEIALNTNNIEQVTLSEDTVNIVFSPGSTSFGMFKNEFDRGNTYKKLVKSVFIQ